jgi:DNA-binding MarR family transcriptional regulator
VRTAVADVQRFLGIVGNLDRLLVDVLDVPVRTVGMSREQWQVLRLLDDGVGRSMGEISAALALPAANTTRLIDALVACMYVYRRRDPLDGRRVVVHLAEPGREALQRVERALGAHTTPLLADFDDEERRVLVELLERFEQLLRPGA